MGDGFRYWAGRDAEEYEATFGERDREANRKLVELRESPTRFFTVREIAFINNPWEGVHGLSRGEWSCDLVVQLNNIYDRVKAEIHEEDR